MRKYVSKRELLWYINLILLILVLNDRGFGSTSAYACDPDRETYEIDDTVNPADNRMEMESRTAAEELEQTVKDCFYTGSGEGTKTLRSQLTEEDYDCLLRIVEAEAGICDEKGKILVANVVLNRMETTEFPDTVREVVYQDHQFSPVSSGRIDRVTITDETVEAVQKALNGIDYSEGALFFVARKHAEEKNLNWFDNSLEFLFEHDGHEFFKCKNE